MSRLFGRSRSPVKTRCRPSGEKQGQAPSGQIDSKATRESSLAVAGMAGMVQIELIEPCGERDVERQAITDRMPRRLLQMLVVAVPVPPARQHYREMAAALPHLRRDVANGKTDAIAGRSVRIRSMHDAGMMKGHLSGSQDDFDGARVVE